MPPGIGYGPAAPPASAADLVAALFGGAPANIAAPPPALLARLRTAGPSAGTQPTPEQLAMAALEERVFGSPFNNVGAPQRDPAVGRPMSLPTRREIDATLGHGWGGSPVPADVRALWERSDPTDTGEYRYPYNPNTAGLERRLSQITSNGAMVDETGKDVDDPNLELYDKETGRLSRLIESDLDGLGPMANDFARRRQPAAATATSGRAELPVGTRTTQLRNADRLAAQHPGAVTHAAEIAESRAYAQALDAASRHGQRGVREEAYREQVMDKFPGRGMPVGTTLVGGGDMDHVPRRKVPSGSLGAISARIAGLGTPFDMPEQPAAVPDFVGRKSDPSELGRRTAAIQQQQANPQYQATLDARAAREEQIAANMQARREAQYIDPNGGQNFEMSPAELSLLMRRNPALAVQAQQQQADRAARSRDEDSLADYRGGQLSVARGELAQRRRDAALDRDTQLEVARIQSGSRGDRLSAGSENLLNAEALKMFEDGEFGDPQSQAARDKRDTYIANRKGILSGDLPPAPPTAESTPASPPQKVSEVATIIAAAATPAAALAALNPNADPETAQRLMREKFGPDAVEAERRNVEREGRKSIETERPLAVTDDQIQAELDKTHNRRRRILGLPPLSAKDTKRFYPDRSFAPNYMFR